MSSDAGWGDEEQRGPGAGDRKHTGQLSTVPSQMHDSKCQSQRWADGKGLPQGSGPPPAAGGEKLAQGCICVQL